LKKSTQYDILSFKSAKEWEAWLKTNHASSNGLWLSIQKKSAAKKSLTYAEALDVALCYRPVEGSLRFSEQDGNPGGFFKSS